MFTLRSRLKATVGRGGLRGRVLPGGGSQYRWLREFGEATIGKKKFSHLELEEKGCREAGLGIKQCQQKKYDARDAEIRTGRRLQKGEWWVKP